MGGAYKFQSRNRTITLVSAKPDTLPSYGLNLVGTTIYNTSKTGYIETWPSTDSGGQTGTLAAAGTQFYAAEGQIPNELLVTSTGRIFVSNWGTAGGFYEMILNTMPVGSWPFVSGPANNFNIGLIADNYFKTNFIHYTTQAAFALAITNGGLIGGAYYSFAAHPGLRADTGSINIVVQAGLNAKNSMCQGFGEFPTPKYDTYPMWSATGTYTTASFVIWGGKVWKSKGTVPGTATDDYTLSSANWTAQSMNNNTTNYYYSYDPIKYDPLNDLIVERIETRTGNIVRFNKQSIDYFTALGITQNAIKDFQWGNYFSSVTPSGVGQITVDEGYFKNLNSCAKYQRNIQVRRKAYQTVTLTVLSSQTDMVFYEGSKQTNGTINTDQTDIVIFRNQTWDRAAATISTPETSITVGTFAANQIQTGDPGTGAGVWKLGINHAASITVDLTKYLEVNQGGTVYKLVTAN